jgi:hypothetical protein
MRGLEALCGDSIIPPEMDNYIEDVDKYNDLASFRYSALDIIDSIGAEDFKELYMVQVEVIKNETLHAQRRFLIEIQLKISEIYDWEFSDDWSLVDTEYQQEELYKFIEFLEFDNYRFLSYVWKFLLDDPIKLMKLDVNGFCKSKELKIIKETEEQLEIHPQNELINIFLKTFYKERYIEWFIKNTQQSKNDIILEIIS